MTRPWSYVTGDHWTAKALRDYGYDVVPQFSVIGSFEVPLAHWGHVELHATCAGLPPVSRRIELSIARGETRDGVLIDLRDGGDLDLR